MSVLTDAPRARARRPAHWVERTRPEADAPAPARPSVTVVIPARNEAENIGFVLRALPSIVDEVVIVDGNSTDGTVEAVLAVRPDAVIVRQHGRGKGDALRLGFAVARGEAVVMLDADGSMNPAEIRRFVSLLEDGFEFVKGSRFMTGGGTSDMTTFRRLGNAGLLWIANTLFGTRHTDLCYGYLAFRRGSLRRLALVSDGFEIETEIVTRAALVGLLTAEVPSFEADRLHGDSNLHPIRDGFRVLRTLLRERFALRPAARARTSEGSLDGREGVSVPEELR